jgi:outer membrane biosynthesis protein TonB
MAARIGRIFANRYTLAYGAALVVHLLFFVFYVPLLSLVPQPRNEVTAHESMPMSFEFVELPRPVADEPPPEATTLRSNRVSRAKDLHDAPLPESYLPYAEGLVQSPAQPRSDVGQQGEGGERGKADAGTEVDQNRRADAANEVVSTDFASLSKQRKTWIPQQPKSALFGRPDAPGVLPMKNLQSHALEQGGLQLSTYNWEFAPYLAYLKRHIGDHIHPPAAFTQFGLIQGQTRLKFRISPDGRLADLEVIDFDGSPYLRDTSTRAVELSANFKPLPAHFPEDYLEITALFHYLLLESQ